MFDLILKFWLYLGLRYDDLYDPMYNFDIKEALNRLPRPINDARNQRHKRAMNQRPILKVTFEVLLCCVTICMRLRWGWNQA